MKDVVLPFKFLMALCVISILISIIFDGFHWVFIFNIIGTVFLYSKIYLYNPNIVPLFIIEVVILFASSLVLGMVNGRSLFGMSIWVIQKMLLSVPMYLALFLDKETLYIERINKIEN